jgi:hypothetical protein
MIIKQRAPKKAGNGARPRNVLMLTFIVCLLASWLSFGGPASYTLEHPVFDFFGSPPIATDTTVAVAGTTTAATDTTSNPPQQRKIMYKPSDIEEYIIQNAQKLGYNETAPGKRPKGCDIWKNPSASTIHADLKKFQEELEDYNNRLKNFTGGVKDLRKHLDDPNICNTLELHKDGLEGIFRKGSLSESNSGFVEPLFPPMRSPQFCFDVRFLLDLNYMVHDFAAMCRKLKPTSRTIFIDMGASLAFHGNSNQPAVYITQLFHKFGFRFDHIYAYEITQQKPEKVFSLVPDDLKAAYHWINVGVSPDPDSGMNPLKMLLENYDVDDFVVIKLDVDTAWVELPLAKQLLEDKRFTDMVDSFYFEHHVHLDELKKNWLSTMTGSVMESLALFRGLREKGIPAHFWV